jgi:hypothetical protein
MQRFVGVLVSFAFYMVLSGAGTAQPVCCCNLKYDEHKHCCSDGKQCVVRNKPAQQGEETKKQKCDRIFQEAPNPRTGCYQLWWSLCVTEEGYHDCLKKYPND